MTRNTLLCHSWYNYIYLHEIEKTILWTHVKTINVKGRYLSLLNVGQPTVRQVTLNAIGNSYKGEARSKYIVAVLVSVLQDILFLIIAD